MLRQATVSDADAIALVEVRAWQAAYQRALGVEFLNELSVPLRATAWTSSLAAADAITVVAEHEGDVIGVCSVTVQGPVAEIASTCVDPLHWHRGNGRLLLEGGWERIGERTWEEAHAWLFLHNAMGRAFLARFGFRMDGTKRVHAASGAEEVRLRVARTSLAVSHPPLGH